MKLSWCLQGEDFSGFFNYERACNNPLNPQGLSFASLGLYQQGAAGVIDEALGTAVLDLKCLHRENNETVGQIPSVRNETTGIAHRHLLQGGERAGTALWTIERGQYLAQVAPLGLEGFVVKGELPAFAALNET